MSKFAREEHLPSALIVVLYLSFAQWLGGIAVGLLVAQGGLTVSSGVVEGQGLQGMVTLLSALALGLMGIVLLVGQRNDLRVSYLGAVLLLSASALALYQLIPLEGQETSSGVIAKLLLLAPAEALAPYCFWRFASMFPRALNTRRMKRLLEGGTLLALVGGTFFFVANLVGSIQHFDWFRYVDHQLRDGNFQRFLIAGCLFALLTSLARFRNASQRDRARARLFRLPFLLVLGMAVLLAVGTVVQDTLLDGLIEPAGTVGGSSETAPTNHPVQSLLQLLFLAVALALLPAIAFSVSVKRALNARLLAPRLLWDLARQGLALALTTFPVLMFLITLLACDRSGATQDNSAPLVLWFFTSLFAVGAFFSRRTTMRGREVSENELASADLFPMLQGLRAVVHPQGWHAWLGSLPGALGASLMHLVGAERSMGFERENAEQYFPVLDEACLELQSLFRVRTVSIDLETSSPAEDVVNLPSATRRWLEEQNIAVLQPLFSMNGEVLGVMAIGRKVDQRPFHGAELIRLEVLAQAVSLFLEQRSIEEFRMQEGPIARPLDEGFDQPVTAKLAAVQCFACDRVFANLVAVCPDCDHQTFPIDEPLILGGKYQLERCIGTGTLGKVYQAHDFVLDRHVAIKFIASQTTQGVRILAREARAMASLESPHLASVYTTESVGNRLFVVCELLAGGTLQEQLGVRPWQDVVALGLRLLKALEPLHHRDLVHGDLKPSNIGFDQHGGLKLLDFGMVRLLDETAPLGSPEGDDYRSSTVLPSGHVGTPLYSPPEAWRGEQVGAAADLWPLAVILWEVLTGLHPFERVAESSAETAFLTREAILNAERGPVPATIKGPGNLERILARALDGEPAHRFVDVEAFRQALLTVQ